MSNSCCIHQSFVLEFEQGNLPAATPDSGAPLAWTGRPGSPQTVHHCHRRAPVHWEVWPHTAQPDTAGPVTRWPTCVCVVDEQFNLVTHSFISKFRCTWINAAHKMHAIPITSSARHSSVHILTTDAQKRQQSVCSSNSSEGMDND